MKLPLVILVLATLINQATSALTCFGDENKCGEDECCIQLANTMTGVCKRLHVEDEACEMKPLKHLLKKHVYKLRCPCREGLKCVPKEGLVGKFVGKCQVDEEAMD